MDVLRLPNGDLVVPESAAPEGGIKMWPGTVRIGVEHPRYEALDQELQARLKGDQPPSEAQAQERAQAARNWLLMVTNLSDREFLDRLVDLSRGPVDFGQPLSVSAALASLDWIFGQLSAWEAECLRGSAGGDDGRRSPAGPAGTTTVEQGARTAAIKIRAALLTKFTPL